MVERKKLTRALGMILVIFGFAILLINAIDYLGGFFGLSSDIKLPSSGIGVVFLALSIYIQMFFPSSKKE
ncbi:MAG: hypothetical protein OEY81_06900 [Candidatus Bathyarchaeota archaeon]|nr:hypothetical protein [Candidatus Bathyarchaeota archaeon]